MYNNFDEVLHISDNIQDFWSSFKQKANDEFDAMLEKKFNLAYLVRVRRDHWLITWWCRAQLPPLVPRVDRIVLTKLPNILVIHYFLFWFSCVKPFFRLYPS